MGRPTDPNFWQQSPPPQTGDMNNERTLNQRFMRELPGALPPQDVIIHDGAISGFESAALIVDTEGEAAADELNVINIVLSANENLHPGMIITLRAKDQARTVTVKNSAAANGINTYDGNDYALSATHWLKLQLRADGKWYEVEGRAMEKAIAATTAATTAQSTANAAYTQYATSSTASGTAAKTATLSGFALHTGARVIVAFSNANTVSEALTLNVNGTGDKQIYNQYGAVSSTNPAYFKASQPYEFTYDANGHWLFIDRAREAANSAKPSGSIIAVSLPAASGQTVTAPATGSMTITGQASAAGQVLTLGGNGWKQSAFSGADGNVFSVTIPCVKDEPIGVYWTTAYVQELYCNPDFGVL